MSTRAPLAGRPPWATGPHGRPGGAPRDAPPWRPPRAVTLWVPVAVSALIQVPAGLWGLAASSRPAVAIGIAVLAIAAPLMLIAARRAPGPVVAAASLAASADLLLDRGAGPPYIAFAFAVVGAIVRGARIWAFVSVAIAWAGTILVAILIGGLWNPFRVAGITFGILVLIGVAEFIRTRRQRWSEQRVAWDRRRQDELQAERVRIARELHDVLAHSLSSINVQAGVGLHLIDRDPVKASEALAHIKETSRAALDEVRSVLGVLRADGADAPLLPEPDLGRLAGLAASFTDDALTVRLGDVPAGIPLALQSALYRIAQEALTNVRRHSTARRVEVSIIRVASQVEITVADDGRPRPDAEPGGGRGLLGMRERAELLGGTFSAGPSESGFVVHAAIPVREGEAT